MNQSYAAYKSQTGPLGTTNAQIFSQYACSVPVRKDGGTLFLAILIADLVFLQALWTVLKLVADTLVAKQDAMAMTCVGHGAGYGAIAMGPVGTAELESQQKLAGMESNRDSSMNDAEQGRTWNGYTPVR